MATNPIMDFLNTAGNDISGGYQQLAKVLTQQVKQAPTRTKENGGVLPFLQKAGNVVGKAVGDQPSINNPLPGILPNAPTNAQVVNTFSPQSPLNPILSGTAAGQDQLNAILGVVNPEEGGALNAEDKVMTEAQLGRMTKDNPTGKSPVQGLDLSKKYGVYAPAKEQAVQNTLNTQVKGTSPEEVANDLSPAIGRLGKQIDQIVGDTTSTESKAYPNGVTYQNLADDMQAKAQSQGLMKTAEGRAAVNKGIAQQINYISSNADAINGNTPSSQTSAAPVFNDDLSPATLKGTPSTNQTQFRRMGGTPAGQPGPKGYLKELPAKGATPPDLSAQPNSALNPNAEDLIIKASQPLDMPTLRNEYMAANEDNAALLKRRNSVNAKPLTDTESAQLLYRDSLGDAISTTNPNVKDLITKQSHIYDAAPDVFKARSDYRNQQAQQQTNNSNKPNPLGGILKGAFGTPLHAIETLGAAGILIGTAYTAGLQFSQSKNYNLDGENITLPGMEKITDPSGKTLDTNQMGQYKTQYSALNQQLQGLEGSNALNTPAGRAAYNQVQDKIDNLNKTYGTFGPVLQKYTQIDEQNKQLLDAKAALKNANPQWFQAYQFLGPKLAGAMRSVIPGYASFAQQINNLKSYGVNPDIILGASDPQSANAAINQQIKSNVDDMKTYLKDSGFRVGASPSSNLLHGSVSAANQSINTGSSKLDAVLSPTPQPPSASPTPNLFQQLSNASAHEQLLSQ